ncbi:MAG: Regulatory protein AtoC [Nitrospirae bacterium]|nr:MAG: sigma-54 dependent DNA-binding response regulator [Nitrospira sp. OLB3]MBV6468721.1 Regulatory protein AtoC [Nitrospirota bacterium]MCE7964054.1 sigma-54-dependent Fis family transcriptional regulator [Nitrospira sp. NTP2]MCK6492755.1 sigma-54 dependent transcriptional regulator [Nitrospira sp.]MEB2337096.1 sigma-54 dependent transcriptional regulator [Nitrospirales bacterium]
MQAPTLLIVEDEERMRRLFELVLKPAGYNLLFASSGGEAIHLIQEQGTIDLIITDLQLGGLSGMDVLEAARQHLPDVPVLIVTGYGTVKSAVEAMQKGAYDYISKPVDNDELKILIARALQVRRLSRDNRTLRAGLQEQFGFDRIVGVSKEMELVKRLAQEVAQTDATVLITGESGTGKDLLARAIHLAGPRAQGPMVAVNCAGIPEHLMESELFGYEKGAFTDAKKSKPGRFQLADHGTLFLDEIGEMSLTAQAKLLRVLEQHVVEPLGAVRSQAVNIRVIAATNQELPELIKAGRFRLDLYYRLNVYQLRIPALRERPEDIEPILTQFLERARKERGCRIKGVTPEALTRLKQYPWPGNVRELHNVVEWLTITCKEGSVTMDHLPVSLNKPQPHQAAQTAEPPSLLALGLSVEEVEKAMLVEALEKTGGNISEASRLLKITRNTLRYRMAKYNLSQP